jgi:hypothetical protein
MGLAYSVEVQADQLKARPATGLSHTANLDGLTKAHEGPGSISTDQAQSIFEEPTGLLLSGALQTAEMVYQGGRSRRILTAEADDQGVPG